MIMISVIIPTVNRSSLLARALATIEGQTFPRSAFEVIVVDNGSTDDTQGVVQAFQSRLSNLHYIFDSAPGLHVGRHRGMQAALGNILVFADDDIEALPTWLSSIADSFEDPDVVLVGGKNLPNFETQPPAWIERLWEPQDGMRLIGALSIIDLGEEKKEISPYFVFGCNFAVRKGVLLDAGGFHPDGMPDKLIRFRGDGESWVSAFILANKFKAVYHPGASVLHLVSTARMTEQYFSRRLFNQAMSDSFTAYRQSARIRFFIRSMLRTFFYRSEPFSWRLSYMRGVFQYLLWYITDPGMREWVHRENYIDNPVIPSWTSKG